MKPRLKRLLRAAKKTAEEYAADKRKTEHLLDEAARKARRDKTLLEAFGEELAGVFRLLRAWAKGRYTVVPWRTIVLALAAVIYFVNPLDLAPDFLPVVGYVDDAGVLAFVVRSIQKDLQRFVEWEREEP